MDWTLPGAADRLREVASTLVEYADSLDRRTTKIFISRPGGSLDVNGFDLLTGDLVAIDKAYWERAGRTRLGGIPLDEAPGLAAGEKQNPAAEILAEMRPGSTPANASARPVAIPRVRCPVCGVSDGGKHDPHCGNAGKPSSEWPGVSRKLRSRTAVVPEVGFCVCPNCGRRRAGRIDWDAIGQLESVAGRGMCFAEFGPAGKNDCNSVRERWDTVAKAASTIDAEPRLKADLHSGKIPLTPEDIARQNREDLL